MFGADRDHLTICALASAPGTSAISVIRVSGSKALDIVSHHCLGLKNTKISSHTIKLQKFYKLSTAKKTHVQIENKSDLEIIDEVVLSFFLNKKSYTGEDSVEISCHGNPLVVQKILKELIFSGCSLALPGEFTYRAFINNKLDLVQAEAVLSLIDSSSDNSIKQSFKQLKGELSQHFEKIEDDLTWSLAHIEASIDFSTEGIDVVDTKVLIEKLKIIQKSLESLLNTFRSGRIVKDGFKVVLAGQPNVGKSSLLNKFIEEDKAIVTNIAGTTRDVIQGETLFEGYKFSFSDTAGLRETDDVVEKMGVERSYREFKSSDIIFFIFDITTGLTQVDFEILKKLKGRVVLIANKLDLLISAQGVQSFVENEYLKNLQSVLVANGFIVKNEILHSSDEEIQILKTCFVSAFDFQVRSMLLKYLVEITSFYSLSDESMITSARQAEYLDLAYNGISQTIAELETEVGYEFISQTLTQSLMYIQSILGKHFDDQILDRVFKEFCLGK